VPASAAQPLEVALASSEMMATSSMWSALAYCQETSVHAKNAERSEFYVYARLCVHKQA
jgi:hypothetical protein